VSKAEDKVPKRKPETTPLMWAHPKPHTKHKHNRKTRRIHQRLYRKGETHHHFSFFTFSARKTPQPEKHQATDLIWKANIGSNFLTLLTSLISFFFLFPLSSDILPQGAKHAHTK